MTTKLFQFSLPLSAIKTSKIQKKKKKNYKTNRGHETLPETADILHTLQMKHIPWREWRNTEISPPI